MDGLKKLEVRMLEAPDQQLSLTDPDARSMKYRGGGMVGYNVQTAVDVDTHLIGSLALKKSKIAARIIFKPNRVIVCQLSGARLTPGFHTASAEGRPLAGLKEGLLTS